MNAARLRNTDLLQLRITLLDVSPPVWRRVLVPASLTLRRLHETIQGAMGWLDRHLYAFRVGEHRYGEPDVYGLDTEISDAANTKLATLVERGVDRFEYLYDFGDDWRHAIVIESVRPAEPGIDYPVFVDGARRCPPEDCGGPLGYQAFLEAMARPDHPGHEEMLDWYGDAFDADDIGRESIEAMLSRVARSRRGGLKARGRPRKVH
ncbi:MAG: plasmid pRiA4b ORF-3 family protein [Alphaproteobacteria bacterium]